MNYYDYRQYFQDIENILGDVRTELRQQHTDINTRLDKVNDTLQNGFTIVSALIVIAAGIKVLFK